MKWSKMSNRERDVLVAETIFGLTVKPASECSPPTALAFWMGAHDYFVLHENGNVLVGVPDYTTSMDAAWQVLKTISARYNAQTEFVDEPFAQFVDELLPNSGGEIWTAWKCMATEVANWTPESICMAALRACGVEIEA